MAIHTLFSRFLLVALVAVGLTVSVAPSASATSCAPPGPEEVADLERTIEATVVSSESLGEDDSFGHPAEFFRYTLAEVELLSGSDVPSEFVVLPEQNGINLGRTIDVGQRYGFAIWGSAEQPEVDVCGIFDEGGLVEVVNQALAAGLIEVPAAPSPEPTDAEPTVVEPTPESNVDVEPPAATVVEQPPASTIDEAPSLALTPTATEQGGLRLAAVLVVGLGLLMALAVVFARRS